MGNSVFDDGPTVSVIHKFYSPNSWVDGKAEEQLRYVASLDGVTKVAAFPDLHPGKYGPVGCAILADRIYPELIGNDIGCGMALFSLDLPAHRLRLEKATKQLRKLGDVAPRENGFGTLGGGNHFCEVLRVEASAFDGLSKGQVCLLVHTGSRGLGNAIFEYAFSQLKTGAMTKEDAFNYHTQHELALIWAASNRENIAKSAAALLKSNATLIADVPHNLVEETSQGWLHRKGAARADAQVPLAGSRSNHSYLMRPLSNPDALRSLAHGSGRRFNRSQMRDRIKLRSSLNDQMRNAFGGHVICDDRSALAEEAGEAYKDITKVVEDLHIFKIAEPIAKLTPLITFKNSKTRGRS